MELANRERCEYFQGVHFRDGARRGSRDGRNFLQQKISARSSGRRRVCQEKSETIWTVRRVKRDTTEGPSETSADLAQRELAGRRLANQTKLRANRRWWRGRQRYGRDTDVQAWTGERLAKCLRLRGRRLIPLREWPERNRKVPRDRRPCGLARFV